MLMMPYHDDVYFNRFHPSRQQIQFTTFALSRDMKFCFIARALRSVDRGGQGRSCFAVRASGVDDSSRMLLLRPWQPIRSGGFAQQ